jgi:two-component system alkaline phosphatase synthesis response regulator PhoP
MPTQALRVLVIDDDDPIRMLCRYDLTFEGFEVVEASDGEEGLEKAVTERPDVIILDRMMPFMDGLSVLRELGRRVETAHIPVVMLTARAMPKDRLESWIAGAYAHIDKPFAVDHLTKTVRKLAEMSPEDRREYRADMLNRVRELAAS